MAEELIRLRPLLRGVPARGSGEAAYETEGRRALPQPVALAVLVATLCHERGEPVPAEICAVLAGEEWPRAAA